MTIIGAPSITKDGCLTPAMYRQEFEAVVCEEGVQDRDGGDLLATQASTTTVSVAAGEAWIEGNVDPGAPGMYFVTSPSANVFAVTNTGVTHTEAIVAVVKDDQYDTGPTQWELDILEPYSAGAAYPSGPLDSTNHSGLIVLATITVDATGVIFSMSDVRAQAKFCESMIPAPVTGAPDMEVRTTSGTFNKTSYPGLEAVRVRAVGGGAGGGGAAATGAGERTAGGGGGGGGYAESVIPVASIPTGSIAVTVGSGGVGGTAGGTDAGNGGTSSFGTLVVATGGDRGQFGADDGTPSLGGDGGVGTSGDLTVKGSPGGVGFIGNLSSSGLGGSNPLGGGALGRLVGSSDVPGFGGGSYGGGGSGGAVSPSGTGQAGGGGAAGVVIIELIY